ncbi:hypothetical protein SOVF_011170 [Spinacia oleracea]|nr:hypothetical protein SOVF_011170 [Spinacia oleracea]
MSCFPCFSSKVKKATSRVNSRRVQAPSNAPSAPRVETQGARETTNNNKNEGKENGANNIAAQTFTFRELATATKNFRPECLIGEDHLFDVPKELRPLDWYSRMKIALDAAKGLEYLHDTANPPVIYRDLKSSNILLEKHFHAKLSDFGLAKLGPLGENSHVSTRVMGTYGYCAPEYQRTGRLTTKSDIYSFGVVLLELITGRRAIDTKRLNHEQNLVTWAQPYFSNPAKYPELADPRLNGEFPVRGLNQAVAIAAMCLQEEETARPFMSDVVTAINFLTSDSKDCYTSPLLSESSPVSDYNECNSQQVQEQRDQSAQTRQQALAEAMEWGSTHTALSRATSYNSSSLET